MKTIVELAVVCCLLCACSSSTVEPAETFVPPPQSYGIEDVARQLETLYEQGEDGLDPMIEILESAANNRLSACSYGVGYMVSEYLGKYVEDGVRNKKIANALLTALENQLALDDTLLPAQILSNLLGVDVGYDEAFIQSFREEDRPLLLKKSQELRLAIDRMEDDEARLDDGPANTIAVVDPRFYQNRRKAAG